MEVIVEVANTHEGEISYLFEHIKKLNEISVKNIKFQYLIPEEFGEEGSENFIEFDRLKIEFETFDEIIKKYPGINFYFDVFGDESLQKVLTLIKNNDNIQGIKLHATNSMNFDLIASVAQHVEEVFISISGLTAIEINELVSFLEKSHLKDKIILTFGVQNYPTNVENIKINKLVELKKTFNMKICLSEHLDGDLSLAKNIVSIANVLGYDFIEKHSTLDRSRRLDDDHSALNVVEIAQILEEQRQLELLFTDNVLIISESEYEYRNKVKSVVFADKDIKKGDIFSKNNIKIQRQSEQITQNHINMYDVLNKISKHDIPRNTMLSSNDVNLDILALILVRSSSSRLPQKATKTIGEVSSIEFLIQRLKNTKGISKFILCTTTDKSDDVLEQIAHKNNIECVRGTENVYERLEKVFEINECDVFLRLTGDNVFIDPSHIEEALNTFIAKKFDYYKHDQVIDGCDFEIIDKRAYDSLSRYFDNYQQNSEYMTLFLKNSYFRRMPSLKYHDDSIFLDYRFTLDYQEDLENICTAYEFFKNDGFSYKELYDALMKKKFFYKQFFPEDKALNIEVKKNVAF